MAPAKSSRGAGGGRFSSTSRGSAPRGGAQRGGQSGRGQGRGIPQGGQTSTPRVTCGYCGKPNHTEDECWRKARKCLRCGSMDHQISNCPLISDTQLTARSNPKPTNAGGTRSRVLARVYSLDQQTVPEPTEVVEGLHPRAAGAVLVD
nr:protein lin-28 homolog A-like [Coffea arabica]